MKFANLIALLVVFCVAQSAFGSIAINPSGKSFLILMKM